MRAIMMSKVPAPKRVHCLCRRIFLAAGVAATLTVMTAEQRAIATDDPAIAYARGLGDDVVAIHCDKNPGRFAEREASRPERGRADGVRQE